MACFYALSRHGVVFGCHGTIASTCTKSSVLGTKRRSTLHDDTHHDLFMLTIKHGVAPVKTPC